MARIAKACAAAAILVGVVIALPAIASATTVADGYFISVNPTDQFASQSVTVTGNGQYYTSPFSGDNCDGVTITVTVTYFTALGTQKSAQTSLGTTDGDGNISGSVTIPADAAPTSVSGHDASVQASCVNSDTFESNAVAVTIDGTAPTTTTTTTLPVSTTTTTTPPSPPTTVVGTTTTTTTTVPTPTAPPATPVTGTPKFTG